MLVRLASRRRRWKAALFGASAIAVSVIGGGAHASPVYGVLTTLPITGASPATPFTGYDLATIDPATQLFYLTNRSQNGIDVYSTATNTFVERIGAGLFAGTQGGNNDIAGPNGVSISNVPGGKLLLAGNGTSNVVAFSLGTNGTTVNGSPRSTSTAVAGTPVPQNRVDGVGYAPGANTILAANNASNPGFLTLINNATGAVTRTILLNGTGGYPNVGGNGVEGIIYNTNTNTFFVALPAFTPGATDAGGVIEIDPATGALLRSFNFSTLGLSGACSPTGLSQGGGSSVFVACSDPTATGSVLLNTTGTGSITVVPGIRGGDQTAYDPTNNTFFEAARFQPGGPVVGIIDGATLALQTLAIGPNDHGIAVDPISNRVYIPTAATNAFGPNCTFGCIGVLTPVPEPGTLPLLAGVIAVLGLTTTFGRTYRG